MMLTQLRRIVRTPRRRGSNLVEFVLTFPIYMWVFFGIIEFGFYFNQRSGVATAAQNGCARGATFHPDRTPTPATEAANEINAILAGIGVDCAGYYAGNCTVTVTPVVISAGGTNYDALKCDVTVTYKTIAGYLPSTPSEIESRGVAILEVQQ